MQHGRKFDTTSKQHDPKKTRFGMVFSPLETTILESSFMWAMQNAPIPSHNTGWFIVIPIVTILNKPGSITHYYN